VRGYSAGIIGAILLQASALIDCVDGEVARIAFRESPMGKWIDITLDQVVHIAVFAAIAFGLWRQGSDARVLWLGAAPWRSIDLVSGGSARTPARGRKRTGGSNGSWTWLQRAISQRC
jgi:hypothetical protein